MGILPITEWEISPGHTLKAKSRTLAGRSVPRERRDPLPTKDVSEKGGDFC